MKLLIVAALCVAAVAGFQPLGQHGYRTEGNDLVLKKLLGHPLERSYIYGEKVDVPTYLRDEIVDQPIYQIDEIVQHPLFRVYYNLPFFHQFWQYPYFQRYVASIYFQRFWQVPAFQQYFVNPALFYKYVYPIVQYFQYEKTYNYNTVEGLFRNKNVLPSFHYNRDQQVNAHSLLEKIYEHLNFNTHERHGRLQAIQTEVELTPEGKVREQTVGKVVDRTTGHVRYTVGDAKIVGEHIVPVEAVYPHHEYYGRQYHRDQYEYTPSTYHRDQYEYTPYTHHRDQYEYTPSTFHRGQYEYTPSTYNKIPFYGRFFQGQQYQQRYPFIHHF